MAVLGLDLGCFGGVYLEMYLILYALSSAPQHIVDNKKALKSSDFKAFRCARIP